MVYLDVVEIGPHPLVGAVGVDAQGAKRLLGLRLAGSDRDDWSAAAKELPRAVVGRGVRLDWRSVVVAEPPETAGERWDGPRPTQEAE